MVGKVLGNRYRVLREIGSGGMAWVYLAEDIKEDQLVAVKVLYPQFGEDLSYIHRFNREAKLASAMTDPHIVRVLDYGADRDIYYLIMEYIEGRDLRITLEERGPFPWRVGLDVIDQLATALEHAHMHGVVHRDIKPQNMMLDDTGLLKVLDFGIARVSTLPSLTQSGFIGSPYYVSPEQAMSEDVDIRSDIYSAGIVLYELLSGNIPFDAKSPWSIISQHIASEPARIDFSDTDVSENVHALLSRMIAKHREDRFQTPTSLRQAIAATLAGQPIIDMGMDTRPISESGQIDLAESLFRRALEAIEVQEWGRATDLLNQTLELDPEHSQAAEKLGETETKAVLVSKYSAAKRAVERQSWGESVKNLEAVVEIAPDYEDAKTLLEQANQSLQKENAQKEITASYAEGVSHFEAGRWQEAIASLREVQRLSPGYKRTEQLLANAERLSQPTLTQKITQAVSDNITTKEPWGRLSAAAVGVLAGLVVIFIFGLSNSATGDDSIREQLKTTYETALQEIENENPQNAIRLFDQILEQDPDYADVAERKRELVAVLTPTPTPASVETPAPPENPLAIKLNEVEDAMALEQWSDTIDILQQIRSADSEFEIARVTSLFCDAYIGRGLETLATMGQQGADETEIVNTALTDFEAGVDECPKRRDLQDQAERAVLYLDVLTTPANQYDNLIQTLTPIVAAEPNYADGNAKDLLYESYLDRGQTRYNDSNVVGALSDYEAALALNVADPSAAQTNRAELLLSLQQPGQPVTPVSETPPPVATPQGDNTPPPEVSSTPPPPVRIKYRSPNLMAPEDEMRFAGRFSEVFLEWEPVAPLAEDEYYDLTIMHIFADEPQYTGIATQETRVQIVPQDIGVGSAGGDRFYWWVTVRKANSAPSAEGLDLPLSPQSEAGTFIWTP